MEKEIIPDKNETKVEELTIQINRLQKKIRTYEYLAETVRAATVIDWSIYTGEGDSDWLSIDRDDYSKIMEAFSLLDLWKPWQNAIPSRFIK
jgi:hypothetical protein